MANGEDGDGEPDRMTLSLLIMAVVNHLNMKPAPKNWLLFQDKLSCNN